MADVRAGIVRRIGAGQQAVQAAQASLRRSRLTEQLLVRGRETLNGKLIEMAALMLQRHGEKVAAHADLSEMIGDLRRRFCHQGTQVALGSAVGRSAGGAKRTFADGAGVPRVLVEVNARPGLATGLAYTPVGGEIIIIEATRMPGSGKLTLTGSLGDVMKESAQTALSYLRSNAKQLGIDMSDFDKHDLHIHVPAGATPKDGPSAGSTISVALASVLTRRLVRSDLAMTGEISLRGRVLRVGGIKEKVMAAARSGLKQVILPAQNKSDWAEVPDEVRKKMKAHFVEHISELIRLALRPK